MNPYIEKSNYILEGLVSEFPHYEFQQSDDYSYISCKTVSKSIAVCIGTWGMIHGCTVKIVQHDPNLLMKYETILIISTVTD